MINHKQQLNNCPGDDSGFTIIESLVALLVAAVLLTAIAPVIVLSTATRVQARRIELATQAARTYIDGVRTGAIDAPSVDISLTDDPRSVMNRLGPPPITGTPADYLIDLTKMPLPTATDASTTLYCFQKDGIISNPGCNTNTNNLFYIQAARIVQSTGTNDGYRLGIRVYRADVDFTKPLTASTPDTKNSQRTFTGGLGDRQSPFIEMTTDIASTATSFRALCQRLGVATNIACD
ncbi:prepilin-type N-terminal cleavage/methylation domain-containing protein [Nostocales cyanobacterium LEGE 11386]|nr:prepilin-type N-terminal cleavage/methylation domain-containing protein [Nostocales cyanobacterium LEGE 11386]